MLRTLSKQIGRVPAAARAIQKPIRPAVLSARRASTDADVFLQGTNANYIDEMYQAWKKDPSSVHVSWQAYFKNLDGGRPSQASFAAPPALGSGAPIAPHTNIDQIPTNLAQETLDHVKVQMLVRAYQVSGHLRAKVDPLEMTLGYDPNRKEHSEFKIENYGWTESDLDRKVTLGPGILPRFAKDGSNEYTIREIIDMLEKTYCGTIGAQYMHIPSRTKCDWIRERVEVPVPFKYTKDEKRRILDRLMWSTLFESFLSTKFPNDKRFGLEGGETMVPGMKQLIDASVDAGIEDIVIGMPHRGRLNMLSNVVRKPNENIFHEFSGSATFDEGSGDVKYHLGMNYQRPTTGGNRVNLSLVANPSHLEAEDPVVLGQTRAIQHAKRDEGVFNKAMGVLMHGDAAVEAQGVVYETLGTCNLQSFSTGGTIHIIVNNQIGFTTDPRSGRSTPYPSDFAKNIDAPVFHVNGDDVEAVIFVFDLAAQWRATFKQDVVIDLICYRKHGHNETDQPSFTQPMMYKKIATKEPALAQYEKKLIDEGTFTKEDIEEHRNWIWGVLEDSFQKSKEVGSEMEDQWISKPWKGFKTVRELATEILPHEPTAIAEEQVRKIGDTISSWPEDINVHRNLRRILGARKKSTDTGEGIDWSTGEALAFGSLLQEGHHIRITGQDVERGTFSQRHAVLHDQDSDRVYTPLKELSSDPNDFVISNSHLSEYGVLGYEYGYSLHDPRAFVMWEAQFGDFANTAQVIIDQFIAAGESKWMQRSGLVLSLPHGYDGQGPEHSSARLERYLQLGNEDSRYFPTEHQLQRQHQDCNIQVAYPTTPANLFHLLRRQMHRQFRKPLILLFSKSLLRHPLARSPISEFTGDSGFQWAIDDVEVGKSINNREEIKRVVFMTGQVYATLHKARADAEIKDTAFVKLEQLHPFPYEQVRTILNSYPNASDIVWCQEEPLNAGAWSYVEPRLATTIAESAHADKKARYTGRAPSASVAAGSKVMHKAQEEAFIKDTLGL